MSDKTYRITVVVLLSLILAFVGISTFSQFRGQRRNAQQLKEGIGGDHASPEVHMPGAFGPGQRRQGQPQFQPQFQPQIQPQQIRPFSQPQAADQGLLENLHELAVQNEDQGNLIRELFGQIEELRRHMLELSEQIETLTDSASGE